MEKNTLDEFYERYNKELYLYIYSMCRNREISEDICQETFLKALLSLPSKHANPRAWLYLVARNLYRNLLKKEKLRVSVEDEERQFKESADVIEEIISRETTRRLYRALQRIDSKKREVLVLQYFAGLSQKEISAIMQLTPENIRVLSYRGKRELKNIMEVNDYDI